MATRSTKTAPKTKATAAKATKPMATKTTTTKTAAAKVVAKPVAAPKATIVEAVTPVVSELPIKKPELIERVMAETGMKKKDVKPVVEAMLAVLGRTLTAGEELTVPPLGKVMIKQMKEVANAKILTLKLRHPTGANGPAKAPTSQD